MSDTNIGNSYHITANDLETLKLFFKRGTNAPKSGAEIEVSLLDSATMAPITAAQNQNIRQRLAAPQDYGYDFAAIETSEEAASLTLEIKTSAYAPKDNAALGNDIDIQLRALALVCDDLNIYICPLAQPPHITQKLLEDQIIARESGRAEAFIGAFKKNGYDAYIKNFFLNNAVQVSVSYKDTNALYNTVRRLAALTAPLALLFNNCSGTLEGIAQKPAPSGLVLRDGLRIGSPKTSRGGLPAFFFHAANGDDFIDRYFDWALSRPLLARYDQNGENMGIAPEDHPPSFSQLSKNNNGFAHGSNFELAFGMVWPHLKLAFIRNDSQNITGGRLEVRALDTGPWQTHLAAPLIAALAHNDAAITAIDALLLEYGFDPANPKQFERLTQDSIAAALSAQNNFGLKTMTGFCRAFVEAIAPFIAGETKAQKSAQQSFLDNAHKRTIDKDKLFSPCESAQKAAEHHILPLYHKAQNTRKNADSHEMPVAQIPRPV
jgi:hypothetical protein